jgi:hypothetical protein
MLISVTLSEDQEDETIACLSLGDVDTSYIMTFHAKTADVAHYMSMMMIIIMWMR